MSELVLKWDEILEKIKEEYEMTNVTFEAWIKPLVIDEEEDNRCS